MIQFLNTGAPLLLVAARFAHPGESTEISPSNWPQAWSWDIGIVIPLLVMAALYAVGSCRIRHRNRLRPAINRWQIASFWTGWLSLVFALDSPLHKLGEELFSAHMTQHEVLMVVAAPLIVLSK